MIGTGSRERRDQGARRRHLLVLISVMAYGAVAALAEPMTWPVHVAVAVPIVIVLVVALRRGWHRPLRTVSPGPRIAIAQAGPVPLIIWGLLLAAFATVQLGHFSAEPRSIYPTLSSLLEEPLTLYPVRVAVFATWAWVGWFLVDR